MKTKFKNTVRSFHGINRKEKLVYTLYNNGELQIVKNLPDREITEDNHKFGKITKNLHFLFESVSADYKHDLANYALALQSTHPTKDKIAIRAYGLFSRMLWSLKKQHPEMDLATLTRQDIISNQYPVKSVVEAMNAGLLTVIEEANMLTHEM